MASVKPCSPTLLPLKKLTWERIIPYLGDAREAVARLDGEVKGNKYLTDLFLWKEAAASLQSHTSLKTVFLHVLGFLEEENENPFLQKIVFTRQALDDALSWGKNSRLGKRFFCHIQARIKQDCPRPEDIGSFRNRQNWIGSKGCKIEDAYFYPPRASRVDFLFRNLSEYLESKQTDPLVQAAIAFAQFLIIHPFMDGNGRAARIFIPIYAMKRGLLSHPTLLLSAYFEKERTDYFQKLYHLTVNEDWEDWIVFFLKGVILQATRIKKQALFLKRLFDKISSLAGTSCAKTLFQAPVVKYKKSKTLDLLIKEKILIAQDGNLYFAAPLFRAMS